MDVQKLPYVDADKNQPRICFELVDNNFNGTMKETALSPGPPDPFYDHNKCEKAYQLLLHLTNQLIATIANSEGNLQRKY